MFFKNKKYISIVSIITIAIGILVMPINANNSKNANSSKVVQKENIVNHLKSNGWTDSDINDFLNGVDISQFKGLPQLSEPKYYKKTSQKNVVDEFSKEKKANVKKLVRVESTRKNEAISKEQCLKEVEAYNQQLKKLSKEDLELYAPDKFIEEKNNLSLSPIARYDTLDKTFKDADGWIELQEVATYKGGTSYECYLHFKWLVRPSDNFTDILGIGTSYLARTNDPIQFLYCADRVGNGAGMNYSTSTPKTTKSKVDGVAVSFNIVYGDNRTWAYNNHRGYLRYTANVNPTKFNGYIILVGDYEHETWSLGYSPSFDVFPSIGVSVSPSISYSYDECNPNPYMSVHVGY